MCVDNGGGNAVYFQKVSQVAIFFCNPPGRYLHFESDPRSFFFILLYARLKFRNEIFSSRSRLALVLAVAKDEVVLLENQLALLCL